MPMDNKSKTEVGTGTGLATAGTFGHRALWAHHHHKVNAVQRKIDEAEHYLSHGGKAKNDRTRTQLNSQKKKAMARQLSEANYARKQMPKRPPLMRGLSKMPKAALRDNRVYPIAATAAGAGLIWHGGRKHFEKALKREDVDTAAAGGAAGMGAYLASGYGAKYKISRPKIKGHTQAQKQKVAAYNKTAIPKGGRGSGDPHWTGYWRNYPKGVPGSRTVRILSRTHGGKTGIATMLATTGAGAAGATAANRKVSKRDITQSAFGVDHGVVMKSLVGGEWKAAKTLTGYERKMMGGYKKAKGVSASDNEFKISSAANRAHIAHPEQQQTRGVVVDPLRVARKNEGGFTIRTGGAKGGQSHVFGQASHTESAAAIRGHEAQHARPKRSEYRLHHQIFRDPKKLMAEEGRADYHSDYGHYKNVTHDKNRSVYGHAAKFGDYDKVKRAYPQLSTRQVREGVESYKRVQDKIHASRKPSKAIPLGPGPKPPKKKMSSETKRNIAAGVSVGTTTLGTGGLVIHHRQKQKK